VVQGLLDHPSRVDDHLETLDAQGFGDPALRPLAEALVQAAAEGSTLDPDLLRRRLLAEGHADALRAVATSAALSGVSAPFLDPALPPEDARALWEQAYRVVLDIAALDRAFSDARDELAEGGDSATMLRLKGERDALLRQAQSGAVFAPPEEALGGTSPGAVPGTLH
jgi:hypothetical protein